jgi:hypothetical protein
LVHASQKSLTTAPTTLAGAIATLEHASQRPYTSAYADDHAYANLLEAAEHLDDTREVGEQFPQMVATALRKISGREAKRLVPHSTTGNSARDQEHEAQQAHLPSHGDRRKTQIPGGSAT